MLVGTFATSRWQQHRTLYRARPHYHALPPITAVALVSQLVTHLVLAVQIHRLLPLPRRHRPHLRTEQRLSEGENGDVRLGPPYNAVLKSLGPVPRPQVPPAHRATPPSRSRFASPTVAHRSARLSRQRMRSQQRTRSHQRHPVTSATQQEGAPCGHSWA
jgi:hypothetical protein